MRWGNWSGLSPLDAGYSLIIEIPCCLLRNGAPACGGIGRSLASSFLGLGLSRAKWAEHYRLFAVQALHPSSVTGRARSPSATGRLPAKSFRLALQRGTVFVFAEKQKWRLATGPSTGANSPAISAQILPSVKIPRT